MITATGQRCTSKPTTFSSVQFSPSERVLHDEWINIEQELAAIGELDQRITLLTLSLADGRAPGNRKGIKGIKGISASSSPGKNSFKVQPPQIINKIMATSGFEMCSCYRILAPFGAGGGGQQKHVSNPAHKSVWRRSPLT